MVPGAHVNQCKEILKGCLMLTAMQGSCACVNLAPVRMRRAIAAAEKAAPAMAALGSWQRREVLEHCVREFQARFEELALSLCIEAGKPIKVPSPLHTPQMRSITALGACNDVLLRTQT